MWRFLDIYIYIWLLLLHLRFSLIVWWWYSHSWMFWINWLMVTIAYILHVDLMILFMILILFLGMFFDGLVNYESFGSTPCFQKVSQLVHPSRILLPYRMVVFFYHFHCFFFMRIMFYGVYHVIPHPPMKFQPNTLCFGWILEVVTLWLPIFFHLVISYSKPHGLTWD